MSEASVSQGLAVFAARIYAVASVLAKRVPLAHRNGAKVKRHKVVYYYHKIYTRFYT